MSSHIINPFKVDTQFTLQIHLIIDFITFKEAMIFGSIRMLFFFCYYFFPSPYFYRFSEEVDFARFEYCLEICHLCVKLAPNYRFSLMRNSLKEPIGWLVGSVEGKRGNAHDGLHEMNPIFPSPSEEGSPEHPKLKHPTAGSFWPPPLPWDSGRPHVVLLWWQPQALLRRGR